MKMKNVFLGLIALLAICMFSCKKDTISENDNSITNVVVDSPYLSKIYWIDYSSSANIKTLTRTYKYDLNKRVIAYYDSTQFGEIAKALYYYTNAEDLPFKSVVAVYSPFPKHYASWGGIDTTYFFYVNNKRNYDSVIRVAVIRTPNVGKTILVTNYSYGSNKIFAIGSEKNFYTNGTIITQFSKRDTAMLSLNGRIDSTISYIREINGTQKDTIKSSFRYDDKPSPFAYLSNNVTGNIFGSQNIYFDQYFQINNRVSTFIIKKSAYNIPTIFRDDYDGQHVYNPNGTLKKIEEIGAYNNDLRYQIIFNYTKL
jgi:hypothetical protein